MKKARFEEPLESVKQAREIVRVRAPSREFLVDAAMIKQLRKATVAGSLIEVVAGHDSEF
jgi:hypothetical protein